MRGHKIGSSVGIVAGLVFVMVNAGGLGDPWPLVLRITGVLAAVVAAVLVVRAPDVAADPPSRRSIRVYGWSVAAMVLAIPVGGSLLNGPLGVPDLTVVWVIAVVGAHFLPFADAFGAPIFRRLSLTLITVAVLGATATLLAGKAAAAGTAVVAGFVLLAFAVQGARDAPAADARLGAAREVR